MAFELLILVGTVTQADCSCLEPESTEHEGTDRIKDESSAMVYSY
jgi:hypothetical protein